MTCTISFSAVDPRYQALPNTKITFVPDPQIVRGAGEVVLIPDEESVITDSAGEGSIALTPGSYICSVMTSAGTRQAKVVIPDAPSALLGNLIDAPIGAWEFSALQQLRNDVTEIADAFGGVENLNAVAAAVEAHRIAADADADAADTARIAAQAARDAANANAVVYADLATGNAAVANGAQFRIVSADGMSVLVYRRVDATPANAVLVVPYPTKLAVDRIYQEQFMARYSAWLADTRQRQPMALQAGIVILLGQSNNTPFGTAVVSGVVSRDVFMPVAGNSLKYFSFFGTNVQFAMGWADVASVVTHTEGAEESPASGLAAAMLGGTFGRLYVAGAAIGARTLDVLRGTGPMQNLYGLVHRLCDLARAAGYDPVVMYSVHHGEADAAAGATEAEYFSDGMTYYRQAKAVAAAAMNRPDYEAPIVFHTPIVGGSEASRNIARAIVRLAKDLPNGILVGGSYQFPTKSDRVHQTELGFRLRGEQAGFALRRFWEANSRAQGLQIIDARRSGTTVTVVFNRDIVVDATVDYGTNLNASNALNGMEFFDDGASIKINTLTATGRVATLTLATAPTGVTQHVQIACQTITATLTSGSNNLPGSQIRSALADTSIYSPSTTLRDFAVPQKIEVRT